MWIPFKLKFLRRMLYLNSNKMNRIVYLYFFALYNMYLKFNLCEYLNDSTNYKKLLNQKRIQLWWYKNSIMIFVINIKHQDMWFICLPRKYSGSGQWTSHICISDLRKKLKTRYTEQLSNTWAAKYSIHCFPKIFSHSIFYAHLFYVW